MCGRTACTLSPQELVQACTFKKSIGSKDNLKNTGEGVDDNEKPTEDDGLDKDSTIFPVWTEAPCGGMYQPSTNIPPTSYTPILYKSKDQLVLQPMLWGLVPSWHAGQDPKSHGLTTNNCRLEGVMTSKLYKNCLSKGRCVVVCEGFYEWERSGESKQPYLVYRAGEKVLYMAGLYSVWRGGDGAPVYNYSIITRESNKLLSWLHHRMPAFLSPPQFSDWLDHNIDPTKALAMLTLPKEGELAWHAVSKEVGNVRNKGAHLVIQVDPSQESSKKKSDSKVSSASKGLMSAWLKRSNPVQKEGEEKKFKSDMM